MSVWTEEKRAKYKDRRKQTRNRTPDDKQMNLIQNKLVRFVVLAATTNRCVRCGTKHPEEQDQHCLPLFSEFGVE